MILEKKERKGISKSKIKIFAETEMIRMCFSTTNTVKKGS